MNPKITYQTQVLPESVLQKLTIDDTPDLFYAYLWEFMGVDIQNADIKTWDFNNILDMVDIAFAEILEEFEEGVWDRVVIVAYRERLDAQGNKTKEPTHAYHISRLWSMFRAKAYVKMCRSREGFALRQVTESRGTFQQRYEGLPADGGGSSMPQQGGQQKKEGWRF